MIPELAAHVWQSTLFAAVAGLMALALENNQARVRHGIWFVASVKFLIPFSLLVGIGNLVPWHGAVPTVETGWTATAEQIVKPIGAFPVAASRAVRFAAEQANRNYLAVIGLALWTCGFVAIAICWLARWTRVRSLRKLAKPMNVLNGAGFAVPVMSVHGLVEPGVVGIFRPALLLPAGITDRLDREQLEAILAHELCHVRHHDNLTAAVHMAVQAIFWFHPLVWWLGVRLLDERERACDEEVLALGIRPPVYAASILSVCKLYVESPLACVSGVTGSDLKKRIHGILSGRIANDLTFAWKAAFAALGAACLIVPILTGAWSSAPLRGEALSSVQLPLAPPGPKFRSVAIERCQGYRFGEIASPAPGRLVANCVTTMGLIYMAYTKSAVRPGDPQPIPLSGDPGWTGSANYIYRIDARADNGTSLETMEGPMLQALLADRFGLKIRRVTKTVPMYALTVAKGGARLQPAKASGCVSPVAFGPPPPSGHGRCLPYLVTGTEQYAGLDAEGSTLAEFCQFLTGRLGKPVVDATGLSGSFGFHLKFANERTSPALRKLYPALSDVLTLQFGLNLERIMGPREFLVIDQVEKPLPE